MQRKKNQKLSAFNTLKAAVWLFLGLTELAYNGINAATRAAEEHKETFSQTEVPKQVHLLANHILVNIIITPLYYFLFAWAFILGAGPARG